MVCNYIMQWKPLEYMCWFLLFFLSSERLSGLLLVACCCCGFVYMFCVFIFMSEAYRPTQVLVPGF